MRCTADGKADQQRPVDNSQPGPVTLSVVALTSALAKSSTDLIHSNSNPSERTELAATMSPPSGTALDQPRTIQKTPEALMQGGVLTQTGHVSSSVIQKPKSSHCDALLFDGRERMEQETGAGGLASCQRGQRVNPPAAARAWPGPAPRLEASSVSRDSLQVEISQDLINHSTLALLSRPHKLQISHPSPRRSQLEKHRITSIYLPQQHKKWGTI